MKGNSLAVLFVVPGIVLLGDRRCRRETNKQVSVQAKRKLYLRQCFLKMKEELFDGHINENSHMLVNFTNI